MWSLKGGSDLSLENMTLVGTNTSAANTGDSATCNPSGPDEWEYGVNFEGVNTGNLTNLNVNHVCGDFVEMESGLDSKGANVWTEPSTNITVTGGTFQYAGRQGFSPTNISGLTINGISMSHVAQDGIDLETDVPQEVVQNVTVENSTFYNISAAVIANFGQSGSAEDNITVTGNTETGTINCYPMVWAGSSTPRRGYTITGNHFAPYAELANLTGLSNVTMNDNVDSGAYGSGRCGETAGSVLTNVNGMTMNNNDFGPTVSSISTVTSSQNISVCGNKDSVGSDLPTACPSQASSS
jgi:hypothetical protein